MTLPKAILFDLDETLVEYPPKLTSWRLILEEFASRMPGRDIDTMMSWLSTYTDWYWADPERNRVARCNMAEARAEIAGALLGEFGVPDDGLAVEIGHTLNHRRNSGAVLYAGAVETLEALSERGVRMALITNGHSAVQREKIVRFDIGHHFGHIQIESEFGIGKPDERVYRHVLAQLDVDAADSWMVGDNLEWDVTAPQRVGIRGIWFDPLGVGLPVDGTARPDRIIRRLSELLVEEKS